MFRVRKFARWLTILLVFLAAFEPGLGRAVTPALAAPTNSAAPTIVQSQPGTAYTAASYASQVSDPSQGYLQLALDLAVGQSVAGTGLKVTGVTSQLAHAPIASGQSVSISDNGTWHVEMQDTNGQTLALDGTLNYSIKGEVQNGTPGDISLNISGTLKGGDATVDIEASESGQGADLKGNIQGNFDSVLTRGSVKSHTTINRASTTTEIGNDLSRTISSSYITRDNVKTGWTQTATLRAYGSGEQEVWLERVVDGPDTTTGPLTITQHYSMRTVGDKASQYLDRFDVQGAGDTYSLPAPAEITFASDGTTSYSFELANAKGDTINISSPTAPQTSLNHALASQNTSNTSGSKSLAGMASPLVSYSVSGAPIADPASVMSMPGEESIGDTAGLNSIGRLPALFAPTSSACSGIANFVFGVALGLGLAALGSILFPELLAIGLAAEGATFGEVLGVVGEEILEQGIQTIIQAVGDKLKSETNSHDVGKQASIDFWSNVLQIMTAFLSGATPTNLVGALGNAIQAVLPDVGAAVCNADPYFVDGDTRPTEASANPAPLQITRVTGGLLDHSTFTTSATGAVTVTGTLSTTSTGLIAPSTGNTSGPDAPLYNDSPNPFVGGSLPKGATAIGTWTWDSGRPYGAMPSHTQPPSSGAQIHYFIHASDPLTPSIGDNLIQYVYLDPQNPPSELYLQFYTGNGNGEQRAYWGTNLAQTGGQAGTATLYPMGPVPQAGGWVRLQVSAATLGLEGKPINGVLYGVYKGQTWWGPTTTSNGQTDNAPDGLGVQAPTEPLTWTVGSQIAISMPSPQQVTANIVDVQGAHIRTLLDNATTQAGYQVITWDGKNDAGSVVPDVSYRVEFSVGGKLVAEHGVTVSPLVAEISTPGSFSLVRGPQVPIVGEAYGNLFSSYTLSYGEGLSPSTWITLTTSQSPALPPTVSSRNVSNPSNLALWDTGLDEYTPWNETGLSGVYMLRLNVLGKDGREAEKLLPVIVGRLAQTAIGGTITSPDGQASLQIPAFATQYAFSLMALMPLSQTESVADWHTLVPTDRQGAGQVYELFPASERFRQPVTLQLPFSGDPASVGIMLGDGTPTGWHDIGGQVDAAKHTLSIQLSDFGGKRALVGAFVSKGALPGASGTPAQLAFTNALGAPSVTVGNSQVGYYSDMQSGSGQWTSLDQGGTALSRVTGADAGLSNDNAALKVTKLAGGDRFVSALTTPYDATKYPILSFDYRTSSSYVPNLLVKSNGTWWQFRIGTEGSASSTAHTRYFETLDAPPLTANNAWHHYQLDLLGQLRYADPTAKSFEIEAISFGQVNAVAFLQYVLMDNAAPGDAYYLDNFAVLNPTNASTFNLTFAPPQGGTFKAYSYTLDQKQDTIPAETAQTTTPAAKVDLPSDAADGMWYLHVRGQEIDGTWSETALYPLLIDRQAPTPGRPNPPPDGAGLPDLVTLPVQDDNGLSLPSVQMQLGGNTYAPTAANGGLEYEPGTQTFEVRYNLLDPRPALLADGQKVSVTIQAAEDYAGNRMAAPFTWSFTVDSPKQANQPNFHQLTANGGEQPALSPDGTTLAFVSGRSGGPMVWLMSADDYLEQASTAHLLLGDDDKANEANPDWSPDGSMLAYVSDAGGSQQVWMAGADGSGAKALTTGDGGAASPTWLSGAKTIVFVRDGNLWQVSSDGTSLRSLTSDPDKPMRSVQAQPGGDLLAVGYKLYQQTIKLYDPASQTWSDVTEGGAETEPAWLDDNTLLYTAPQTGEQSTIWEAGLSQSAASIIQGSGVPGTADMQSSAANPALGAQEIALVSTRSGDRNIWVRQDLRISQLEVQPSAGAPAGDPFTILYTLPTSATITMRVIDASGAQAITLVDGASQSPGAQQATWNGKDANGKPLAAGDYVVELSAKLPSGDILSARANARVLDPASYGTLSVEIDQWAGEPVSLQLSSLSTVVFPHGNRTSPLAKNNEGNNQPDFKLPSGQYDIQVEYQGNYTMQQNVSVVGGQTTNATVDLGLGQLEVSVLSSPGQPATGNPSVQVFRSNSPAIAGNQTEYDPVSDFLLTPGTYNIAVLYDGVEKQISGVQISNGAVTRQEVDLGSGLVSLTVYMSDGQLIQGPAGEVSVQAYRAGDHTQLLATNYFPTDPAQLRLPAGSYDLNIEFKTAAPEYEDSNLAGGSMSVWLNDVQVDSGQTTDQEYNLRLTPVTLKLEEAPGVPVIETGDDIGKLGFFVYPHDAVGDYVADTYTNTLHLLLPEGQYDVVADYSHTDLRNAGPFGGTIDVKYGQSVDKTIDLSLGHLAITVRDEAGHLVDETLLAAYAYPADAPDRAFASVYTINPLELTLRAGVRYNIDVSRSDGTHLILSGQQVQEGQTVQVEVNTRDFK